MRAAITAVTCACREGADVGFVGGGFIDGFNEVGFIDVGFTVGGFIAVGFTAVGFIDVGFVDVGFTADVWFVDVGFTEVGFIVDVGFVDVGFNEVGFTVDVGFVDVGFIGVGFTVDVGFIDVEQLKSPPLLQAGPSHAAGWREWHADVFATEQSPCAVAGTTTPPQSFGLLFKRNSRSAAKADSVGTEPERSLSFNKSRSKLVRLRLPGNVPEKRLWLKSKEYNSLSLPIDEGRGPEN
jgi:hypothetical protein